MVVFEDDVPVDVIDIDFDDDPVDADFEADEDTDKDTGEELVLDGRIGTLVDDAAGHETGTRKQFSLQKTG